LPCSKSLLGEKIRDEFLDFRAGDCKDAEIRATQDAKAGMRIEIGGVKTDLYCKISNLYGSPFFGYFLWRRKESDWCACGNVD